MQKSNVGRVRPRVRCAQWTTAQAGSTFVRLTHVPANHTPCTPPNSPQPGQVTPCEVIWRESGDGVAAAALYAPRRRHWHPQCGACARLTRSEGAAPQGRDGGSQQGARMLLLQRGTLACRLRRGRRCMHAGSSAFTWPTVPPAAGRGREAVQALAPGPGVVGRVLSVAAAVARGRRQVVVPTLRPLSAV
jgi:hypothetical protein